MIISINLKELPIEVDCDYYPEEPMVRYYPDGSGYPGSGPEIHINNVWHAKELINEFIDEMDWWDLIEELVLDEINKIDD